MNELDNQNKASCLANDMLVMAESACWQQVGVWGDRTCPELSLLSHCHHCATYQTAGTKLLNQPISPTYLAEQTVQVAAPEQARQSRLCSTLIFRLATEWIALPADLCQQILSPLSAHTLPHRSNSTLLGIVNVRGQLLLKISLLPVLGLWQKSGTEKGKAKEKKSEERRTKEKRVEEERTEKKKTYSRMVVVSKRLESGLIDTWAFDVDEMYGVRAVPFDDLQVAAAGVISTTEACTRYVFDWQGKRVSFLDDIKLFELVRKQAL